MPNDRKQNNILNPGDTLNTTVESTGTPVPWMPSRPIATPVLPPNIGTEVATLRRKVTPLTGIATRVVHNGLPKSLLSVSATQEPSKQQDRVMSQVIVTFTRDANDKTFAGVNIWFRGYKGNRNPVEMTSGSTSPIIFLCEATGERVTVLVQLRGESGITEAVTNAAITTVLLNGQTQKPPAPSISQSLIGTATGYQFSFNQVPAIVDDVVSVYNIYRNTTPVFDGTQKKIKVIPHDPQSTGSTVVTDTVVDATGVFYYYWVTAVDTMQLESVPTAAQNAAVPGSIGSIPPFASNTTNTGFTWDTTATSVTLQWPTSPIYRADGTIFGTLTASSQAITGLLNSQSYFIYPYWDETAQAIAFVGNEITYPTIRSVRFDGPGQGYVKMASSITTPSAFSIECWVKFAGATSHGLIDLSSPQAAGAGVAATIQLFVDSAGELKFYIQNSGTGWVGIDASTNPAWTTILDAQWHHIVVTYASGTGTIYVDNTQYATSALMGTILATGSLFWHIGVVNGLAGAGMVAENFFAGEISHVAIYPAALTASQINNHYVMGVNIGFILPNSYDSIVISDNATNFWKLVETSGTLAAASIGSITGTYTGTVTLNLNSETFVAGGLPAIAWPNTSYLASQAQALRNRLPLTAAPLNPQTTAGGSGGGSGGGTGGGGGKGGGTGGGHTCFSPNTKIKTLRGEVAIEDLTMDDFVLTAKGTWRSIERRTTLWRSEPMLDMGDGELTTPDHMFLVNGKWIPAREVGGFTEVKFSKKDGTLIHNLHIETEEDDDGSAINTEHSYTLANGNVVHNMITTLD